MDKKQGVLWLFLYLFSIVLLGCSAIQQSEEDRTPLEYQVMEDADLPEMLQEEIKKEKKTPFRMTYGEMGVLYIVEGYGEKWKEGYCIEWVECTENKDAIYIETTLHGVGGNGEMCKDTCPYSVIRLKWSEKPVIFKP